MREEKKKKINFRTAWLAARDLLWQHRKRLLLGLGLILINRPAGLVLPASTKYLIDDVIGKGRSELLMPLGLAVGAATIVQALTSFSLTRLLSVAAQRAITEMRKNVEQHVMRLPVSYFDSTKTGILISRIMSDAEGIRNLVGTGVIHLIGGTFTAVIALGVLFYLNWQLTIVIMTVLVLFMVMMGMGFKYLRPLFRARGELNAQVSGRLAEALGGVRIVKSYTAEKREDRIFAHGVHGMFRNVAQTLTGTAAMGAGAVAMLGVIGVLTILMGGRAILNETMTLGDLMSYVFFTLTAATPMIQISSIGTQLTEALAGLDRIREIKQMATEADEDAEREPLEGLKGDIAFDDVWFEYKPDVPVIKGVSFTAPAGSTTALVGSSGSGKSTVIGLVMAFHHPNEGRILVDGRDLAEVRLYDYRSHLGIVMQDNFLFDGTIAENIAYGNPYAERQLVERAGQIAHCNAFIDGFDEGYDTVVGERGVKLSGGQRQRVAIARAILADPKILILDEATSSLDSESEGMIQDGLKVLRHGRTTFVIAHRLSTIQSADQILVIEDGGIVESGTHDELLAEGGRYRELYDKQYKLERDRFINPGEDFTPEPVEENSVAKLATGPAAL